jgi:hypothetical protein
MRRLNESASWLSDVSGLSDDEPAPEQSPEATTAGLPIDTRRLCLAEMLNESATFLDESDPGSSVGDGEQEAIEEPQAPVSGPAAISARAGFLEEGYGYRPTPVVTAGVARSFSC